jgi:hypothetical protein
MLREIVGRDNVIARADCGLGEIASGDRLGQAARPMRRRGDREQEVVELNSIVPVRYEGNREEESLEIKI